MKDYEVLKGKYPNLYKNSLYFECGPGWYDIIDNLSSKLEKLIDPSMEFPTYATQVKEKYGTLRFYLSTETDEMGKLVDEAEELSSHTCEICGLPGKLIDSGGWYETRCDQCK